MDIRTNSRQHVDTDSTEARGKTRRVARELALNPLWMVTFAAGLLFGMLAVFLTAG